MVCYSGRSFIAHAGSSQPPDVRIPARYEVASARPARQPGPNSHEYDIGARRDDSGSSYRGHQSDPAHDRPDTHSLTLHAFSD